MGEPVRLPTGYPITKIRATGNFVVLNPAGEAAGTYVVEVFDINSTNDRRLYRRITNLNLALQEQHVEHGDDIDELPTGGGGGGSGDMLKAVYDPTNVLGDAFDMANMVEAADAKVMTAAERTKLGAIEALADVTDAANVAAAGAFMLASHTSDNLTEGVTKLLMTTTERSKLGGIEALADVTDATNVAAAGAFMKASDDSDDLTEGVTKLLMTPTERTKLAGIEALADVTDATNVAAAGAFMKAVDTSDDLIEGAVNLLMTTTERAKLGHITVTQAVDLDAIETRVNQLDASVVLAGTWDASVGTFPGGGTAQAGASYICSVGGTVDGVEFVANDRIVAIVDNADTTTYAANWHKLDYTDAVLSVAGRTGAITLVAADISDASANGQSLITAANYAAMRTLLGLGTADSPTFAAVTAFDGADTATSTLLTLEKDRATPTAFDQIRIDWKLSDSAGNQDVFARLSMQGNVITSGAEVSRLILSLMQSGALTDKYYFQTNSFYPASNDGAALGVSGNAFSDLFLASGGVIDFAAGDVTITHATDLLALQGGNLILGHSASIAVPAGDVALQIHGTTGAAANQAITRWAASAGAAGFFFAKSRGATIGTRGVVQADDQIGYIAWAGDDGTNFLSAAAIAVFVDGTPGSNDMPGRIVFQTTADGAASPTNRLIIDSAGTFKPAANDGAALGTAALSFSDLFLASGGVINFASGDVLITHSTNALVFSGASGGYFYDAGISAAGEVHASGANGAFVLHRRDTDATVWFMYSAAGNLQWYDAVGASDRMFLNASTLGPALNDGLSLGVGTLAFSDLFLASGGVINFDNGDVLLTHGTNTLGITGADNGIIIGNVTGVALAAGHPAFQIHGLGTNTANQSITRWANVTGGSGTSWAKSRGAAVGTRGIVADNDQLGFLAFQGDDGTNFITAANIVFEVDGTPGTNDMPGRITFRTTADGASSPTNRLILDSAGVFKPATNDGVALGTGALSYSDLFLASGAVINFNNGDVLLTHSSDLLNLTGGEFAVDGNVVARREPAINTQTGTTYTFVLTDNGKIVEMNNASANVLTIPTNTAVAFPVGTVINVIRYGAGVTTVDGDTGVTVNGVSGGGAAISARYSGVSLYKRATNEWIMTGNHGVVS